MGVFEEAKQLAKEEKALGLETWCKISFVRYEREGSYKRRGETLKVYDIPQPFITRWDWLINWRRAYYICKYPKSIISTEYYFYEKKLGINFGFDSALSKMVSAKAQVTKVKNALQRYIEMTSKTLFYDPDNDPIVIKLKEKLRQKEENLARYQEQVKDLVETHKKPSE